MEDGADYSTPCLAHLHSATAAAGADYRLHASLAKACDATIVSLCKQACGIMGRERSVGCPGGRC